MRHLKQKIKAALSCSLATAVDFITLTALVQLAELAVLGAAAAGAAVGASINYFLHRHHVFGATGHKKRTQMPRYLAVALSTMALTAIATALLADWVGLHFLFARAVVAIAVFFLWHEPLARRVFREKPGPVLKRVLPTRGDEAPCTGGIKMDSHPIFLTVIVPAYNEEARLPRALEAIGSVLEEQSFSAEVIVVNDGSTDGTADTVREFMSVIHGLRLVDCPINQGKGNAVKTGVAEARGEIVLFMDADNSVSLDQASALIEKIEAGADAAIGSRYMARSEMPQRQPWYRVVWSRAANWVVQRMLLRGIVDTQCGFKAFRARPAKRAFSQLTISGWGFDLEVLTVLDRMGCSIVEVPVVFHDDSRSKINPLVDLWGVVQDFLRVQRNLIFKRYDLRTEA